MRPGVDCRVYGRIRGIGREVAALVAAEAPFDTVEMEADGISFEHEGRFVDAREFVARAVGFLPEGAEGDVDVIDNEAWTITRYALRGGAFEVTRHGLDDVLEHTKGEGNF
ncbi:hypothetical protein [Desulfolutivibrio sulfoxidireducens]|uniref:hypothetical protein n=1 Tax=Desulfolutivibrio sulfoxidireducens TaxID=2773299 RepID=UPI00159D18DA|nr:hypothetical protein [Desulfolutivibrio sulfoxidireducens]QLA15116.1 hypothetical protein GD605_02650 [Desulfolutivibrio sulfoxidireducens]QLA18688.1 hypothetical protein GD604_02555 [Desulfolutivibrio sulfoxidireducens]